MARISTDFIPALHDAFQQPASLQLRLQALMETPMVADITGVPNPELDHFQELPGVAFYDDRKTCCCVLYSTREQSMLHLQRDISSVVGEWIVPTTYVVHGVARARFLLAVWKLGGDARAPKCTMRDFMSPPRCMRDFLMKTTESGHFYRMLFRTNQRKQIAVIPICRIGEDYRILNFLSEATLRLVASNYQDLYIFLCKTFVYDDMVRLPWRRVLRDVRYLQGRSPEIRTPGRLLGFTQMHTDIQLRIFEQGIIHSELSDDRVHLPNLHKQGIDTMLRLLTLVRDTNVHNAAVATMFANTNSFHTKLDMDSVLSVLPEAGPIVPIFREFNHDMKFYVTLSKRVTVHLNPIHETVNPTAPEDMEIHDMEELEDDITDAHGRHSEAWEDYRADALAGGHLVPVLPDVERLPGLNIIRIYNRMLECTREGIF